LGEKLGMDATEDIRILVLLWKMGCSEKPAQISKQEWMQGCATLEVDSWEKLKKLVPSLDTGFLEQTPFKDFYKFCFQFNRQGTHKTLDKELAIALLKLVLKEDHRIPTDRLDTFCSFLATTAHSHITLDEWTLFLDFCYECDDLSMYDESTSAWPVLFDEYVEYVEKNGKGKN
jgi:Cullin binding